MCGEQLNVDLMFDSRGDVGSVVVGRKMEIDRGVSASERENLAGT